MEELEKQVDDIFEDLIVGHNFEYARGEVIRLAQTYANKQTVAGLVGLEIDAYDTRQAPAITVEQIDQRIKELTGEDK